MLYVNVQFAESLPAAMPVGQYRIVSHTSEKKDREQAKLCLGLGFATLSGFLRVSVLRLLVDYFRNQSVF
jgi:hypothetical protein